MEIEADRSLGGGCWSTRDPWLSSKLKSWNERRTRRKMQRTWSKRALLARGGCYRRGKINGMSSRTSQVEIEIETLEMARGWNEEREVGSSRGQTTSGQASTIEMGRIGLDFNVGWACRGTFTVQKGGAGASPSGPRCEGTAVGPARLGCTPRTPSR